MKVRSIIRIGIVLLSLALCLGLTGLGGAQERYPTREIMFITGSAVGATTDLIVRSLCSAASKILGQPIIVVNKVGASMTLGILALKNAKPDGYTIGAVSSGSLTNQLLQKKAPYDMLKDYKYIMQSNGYLNGILVQPGAPWKNIQELIAYAKNNPGKVRMGVGALGSGQHIAMERLSMKTGVKFNLIPYEQSVANTTALLGGEVDVICATSVWVPHVEAGQLRLLALFYEVGDKNTAMAQMAQFPNVPSVTDLYGIDAPMFDTVAGPKGLPSHVVDTLHMAFRKAQEDPGLIETAKKFNIPIVYRNSEDLIKYINERYKVLDDVIGKLGIRQK